LTKECSKIEFSSVDAIVNYVHGYGMFGPVIIVLMFLVQAMAPVIPYAFLAGAAGIIYGKITGFFMAWGGAVLGTLVLYLLARYTCKGYFERMLENKHYELNMQNMSNRKVFFLIVIFRIFPIIPTPIINIGSGVSGVPIAVFAASSALGMLPWSIAYVFLGDYLKQSHDIMNAMIIFAVIILIIMAGAIYFRKHIRDVRG